MGLCNAALGQAPVANFAASATQGCSPLTVTFTDQSSGSPTVWNWEFSNGTLASVQNPIVTFSTPGTYSVKLVVQNASGIAQIERIDYITVFPTPNPNFTSDLNLACIPATIQFTDLSVTSVGTITAWEWDFGDGGTSTSQNPSHVYSTVGFFTVTLSVTSSTGCKVTVSRGSFIRTVGAVSTEFAFTQPSTCRGPFTVNFQNQSAGPGVVTYNWNFGNGQTSTGINPSTVYAAPGTYTVTLNSQSSLGCSGSIQKTITIDGKVTDFIAPTNICLNQPVTFTNNSSAAPIQSNWSFGDGTVSSQINPIKTYLTAGTYAVKVINRYTSCIDSATKTITVNGKPVVDFIADDSTFCSAPANVQFTDRTPGATAWLWEFGDGTTSTLQNPTHQYVNYGMDTVKLTVTTATGCFNTLIKPDYIQIQEPTIVWNFPAGGCVPFTWDANAMITTLDPVATYAWDLGAPGGQFTVANPPPFTYTVAGTYNISLTITTVSGCTKTFNFPNGVRTGVPPVPSFTAVPLDACAIDGIAFTDNSTTTPGAFVTWAWDFGDNTTSTEQNPNHIYVDTGMLTVTLTVSNNGCERMTSRVVHIRPPVAKFDYIFDCITRQVVINNTSIFDPGLAPLTYLWEMGDPANTTFNTLNPPPFVYPGPGIYPVSLTVTNGPCLYKITESITIANEPPDFTASKNPVCKNEFFTLTAINSNPANIRNYIWRIGGVLYPQNTRTITVNIPTNGSYSVSLMLVDINNCVTTQDISNFLVVNGPTANFDVLGTGGCQDKQTTFNDLSTPAGGIVNWHFTFGDSTEQDFTAPPFTHTYIRAGSYAVTLLVSDAAGCTDLYASQTGLLVTNPKVGFRADSFYCPISPLQFSDTSSGAGLTYSWNFGNGTTSTLQNPTVGYAVGDADYTVQLVITDISGCKDSVTKVDYVKIRSPKAAFDIKDTITICPPLLTKFTFNGADYASYLWDFGDGAQLANVANPNHFYSNYGTFTPALILTGPGGCTDTARSSVTVYDPADVQINYGPPTTACNSLNVDFNLVLPPGFKFIFFFGDGTADSTRRTSFSHFYSKPSLNSPLLIIYDTISGCQTVVAARTRIDVLGALPLFGIDRNELCDNGPVTFTDFTTKNEPIITTLWDFGDGGTSNATSPVHTFTQPGTYYVRLNITTQSNCSSYYQDTILVYRTPVPAILSRDTICVAVPDPFNGIIAVPDSITNWQWNFGNGQTSTTQNNSIAYNTAGDYNVQLITSHPFGCADTTTKPIYVSPVPTAIAVQDPLNIISGQSTTLAMTYTGNIATYNWSPQYRLNCFDCPAPVANPQSTTTYRVQVQDIYGCNNTGEVTVVVVCNNQNFFVPNTFSPNGDGQNEVFYPRGTGLFRIKSMIIFNRWGQIVFDRQNFAVNDPSLGWNGTFKGAKAGADVYIFMIEIICDNNTVIPVKGNVTLLR